MSENVTSFQQAVRKQFGDCVLPILTKVEAFTYISTGVFPLDYVLTGGLPEGHINMLVGWESSGKSTLVLKAIAQGLKKHPDSRALLLDLENTFDPYWAMAHGVDLDRLDVVFPKSGEIAVDIMDAALDAEHEFSVLAFDSIAAIAPEKELEESAADHNIALRARLFRKMGDKLRSALAKRKHHSDLVPTIILTNQYQLNPGQMFGDNRVMPGGQPNKYLPSLTIELGKAKEEVLQDDVIGEKVISHTTHTFKIKKTKINTMIQAGEFRINRHESNGLPVGACDDYLVALTTAKKQGILTGGGGNQKLACLPDQSFSKREDMRDYLIHNPQDYLKLKQHLIMNLRTHMKKMKLPIDEYLLEWGLAE